MTKMCRKIYVIIALEAECYDTDLTFEEAESWDYTEFCIIDCESDKVVFHNDNTHDDPARFLDGFIKGIRICGQEEVIEPILLFMNDNESPGNSDHVRAALKRYIEKGE